MMFGEWGNTDVDECVRIVHAALDDGVNFIDTADMYSAGQSEEIVGRALKGRRDDVVLATKVHMEMGPGQNQRGNSRVWIVREVEDSLRRLGTDHIDLYQIHRPEPETDVEETLGALTDLQRQGKIRYFGSSTFPGWQMVEAQWTAERRGLSRFRSSSRLTRYSCGTSSTMCCPWPSATAWASSCGARSAEDGSPDATGVMDSTSHHRLVPPEGKSAEGRSRRSSTSLEPRTSGSWTWSSTSSSSRPTSASR